MLAFKRDIFLSNAYIRHLKLFFPFVVCDEFLYDELVYFRYFFYPLHCGFKDYIIIHLVIFPNSIQTSRINMVSKKDHEGRVALEEVRAARRMQQIEEFLKRITFL